MVRKGSRKVRTGCLTCKLRKVKCDEGKPACDRCTSTGRKCDGYAAEPQPGLTWYRPSNLFQSIDKPIEGRALQLFCDTAAPSLAGPLDSYFWTHLVLQFSNFEPATHQYPQHLQRFAEAQYYMDAIVCRASRFIRQGDPYRYGQHVSDPVSPDLLGYQLNLQQTINDWHARFTELAKTLDLSEHRNMACSNVMSRYRIARLWALATFEKCEVFYDNYINDLNEAIDLAIEHSRRQTHDPTFGARPQFTFEAGFLPSVVFSVMRCRDLRTRLKGLHWLRDCGSSRENMWEAEQMYPVCRKLVEIEHDIVLDQHDQPIGQVPWNVLPPEESRSKDFGSSPTLVCQENADGHKVWGRLASYAMRTPEGVVWTRREFIPWPSDTAQAQVDQVVLRSR
ncbi:hypothetical protein G7054_g14160 [Neopestalotiopsis clavispora]|nr:hypothetical protein G7054_g14160 [Neopestalotiopsis clavispora]